MRSYLRLKIAIVMVIVAIFITFIIVMYDYLQYKDLLIENYQNQIQQTEESVMGSLKTIDKAYIILDQDRNKKMEENTHHLLKLYEENPNFDEWNFNDLKHLFDMDIYIVNNENIVTHSSFVEDVGLDFDKCCRKLASELDNRRASGEFFADGMDIEQVTGEIKKYSYMATPDKKYLFQLGHSLQNGCVFKGFNFLETIEDLVQSHSTINEINVLNIGGLALGNSHKKLSGKRREAFEKTLLHRQDKEFEDEWNNELATYRYVLYDSDFDVGITKNKVVEIIYNDYELQKTLSENKKSFIIQLLVVLAIIALIAFIIHSWVSKEVYLANHDSLTGLKNRAAFDELLAKHLSENSGTTALMMIDLDDFKLINDCLGHDKGDYVLQLVAETINSVVQKESECSYIFRLGGDEFIVLLPATSKHKTEYVAQRILHALNDLINRESMLDGLYITASIGIALNKEEGFDRNTMYQMADIALYASKEEGKNQYSVYTNEMTRKCQSRLRDNKGE